MNSAYGGQSGNREQMLDVLEALAARCDELGEVENALLLRAGREAVALRQQCFGVLERPKSCSLDSAWSVFRRAIRRREYWLSFQELQLVGALHQAWVRVFIVAEVGARGGQRYLEELHCSRLHLEADASNIVKVVLDTHGRPGEPRGHFSRLFAEPEWRAHFASVERPGMIQPGLISSSEADASSSTTDDSLTSGDDSDSESTAAKTHGSKQGCHGGVPSVARFTELAMGAGPELGATPGPGSSDEEEAATTRDAADAQGHLARGAQCPAHRRPQTAVPSVASLTALALGGDLEASYAFLPAPRASAVASSRGPTSVPPLASAYSGR